MFQNNLLNIGACSLKKKKVILRGPKDICLSRRCVRLKWHVPPYLWRLLRTEAASAFFAALAASAFLGCIRLWKGNDSDCQRPGNWISHGWTSSRVHFGLAAKSVMRPELSPSGACLVLQHQARCSEFLFKDIKRKPNTEKLLVAKKLFVLLQPM